MCYSLLEGEFEVPGRCTLDILPRDLRSWLQSQDGLKIDGASIDSINDLLRSQNLLSKRPYSPTEKKRLNVSVIFIEIVARYYHRLTCKHGVSSLDHLTVRGTQPIALKCSLCESRLLDDPLPRFKKSDKNRYVVHRLKLGCGSEKCQKSPKPGFAVPFDIKIPWAAPKTVVLDRPPQAASWASVLLRQGDATSDLPSAVDIICRNCGDQSSIQKDESPRWTIEMPPRYVIRKPRCKVCVRRDVTWRTVDSSIAWLDQASISKTWIKKKKE